MMIEGLHEKGIFTEKYPFRLTINTEENFNYPHHWHNAVELVYVFENGYTINVNNSEYHLNEKDILFIPGGDIHGFSTKYNKGKRVFIQFDISMLEAFGDINVVKPFLARVRKISCIDDGQMHCCLKEQIVKIVEEYEKRDLAYAMYLNARIYDIIVILSRGFAGEAVGGNEEKGTKKIFGLRKLNKVFEYIEQNYQDNITLKSASNAAGFSEYHFSRVFKETTEKNFHAYLNEFRVKKAEKLLTDTESTIIQVAGAAGFNSVVTFNRIFKREKGCSPTEYRKLKV